MVSSRGSSPHTLFNVCLQHGQVAVSIRIVQGKDWKRMGCPTQLQREVRGRRMTCERQSTHLKNAFRFLTVVIHEKCHFKWYPNYRTEKALLGEGNPDSKTWTPMQQSALSPTLSYKGFLLLMGQGSHGRPLIQTNGLNLLSSLDQRGITRQDSMVNSSLY